MGSRVSIHATKAANRAWRPPKVQARIARRARQRTADGSTHWSCRKMAEALGISKSTVQRVWAQAA
jgi:AraC-like DNA-binding protein